MPPEKQEEKTISKREISQDISEIFPDLHRQFVCILDDSGITIKLAHDTSRDTLLSIKKLLKQYPD